MSVAENGSGNLVVTLSRPWKFEIVLPYSSTQVTATQGSDYTAMSTNITIPAGLTSVSIPIAPVDDAVFESNETFQVTFFAPVTVRVPGSAVATVTILNDEPAPEVEFVSATDSVMENDGTGIRTIGVQLDRISEVPVSVNYSVTAGTANVVNPNRDALLPSGVVNFPALSTSQNITLNLDNDSDYEGDETIDITLASPVSAVLGTQSLHTLTIQDDESTPSVQFSLASSSVAENVASGNLAVAVSLSGPLQSASNVQYRVVAATPGTATGGGVDYTLVTGTLNLAGYSSGGSFSIPIINDNIL